jgi:putative spermidine/putrescine transport system permease protein
MPKSCACRAEAAGFARTRRPNVWEITPSQKIRPLAPRHWLESSKDGLAFAGFLQSRRCLCGVFAAARFILPLVGSGQAAHNEFAVIRTSSIRKFVAPRISDSREALPAASQSARRLTRSGVLIIGLVVAVYGVLMLYPLLGILQDSFRLFVPGRIGSQADAPFTLANYTELLHPSYAAYFWDTFRIGFIASFSGVLLAFPIAHFVARRRSDWLRRTTLGFLITLMFLSVLVRVYSIELSFGPVGFAKDIASLFGERSGSRFYIEFMVVLGILHYVVPMSALVLIGTIQNVNPRLVEAAQALGAARWKSHLAVTLPLCARGLLSAFLISFTLSISAFVVPMVLGRGKVLFVSNLIYNRFSELANFPSGSAVSMVMLVISLLVIYAVSRLTSSRWDRTGGR